MTFVSGTSGNPKGRPPKERALAVLLQQALDSTVTDRDGKRTARKRVQARLLAELVSEGETTLPNGTKLVAGVHDWLDAVKFVYSHVDGPARATLDIEGTVAGHITIETRRVTADTGSIPEAG